MQVELKDIARQDLEMFIYEEHKTAFGIKGRHYNFASMSMDELRAEAEYIADACDWARAEEAHQAEVAIADLEGLINDTIYSYGAGDRATALRWLTQDEKFYHSQDVEHWVWNQGVLFTDYGRELVKELEAVVTYIDYEDAA